MHRFMMSVLLTLAGIATAQAKDPNWLYVTIDSELASAYDEGRNPAYAELCVIEGWTTENSGIPEVSKAWYVSIAPSGPNNPNALGIILDSIDLVAQGSCNIAALPWYVPEFRKPISDRMAAYGAIEITALSALQTGGSVAATSEKTAAPAAATGSAPLWRYYTRSEMLTYNIIDPINRPEQTTVCGLGTFTALNSGFPKLAPKWRIYVDPAPATERETLDLLQYIIKPGGTCSIFVFPRSGYAHLAAVLAVLEKQNFVEVPSLSNPEAPYDTAATATIVQEKTPESAALIDSRVSEIVEYCEFNPVQNLEFDCACIGAKIRTGLEEGRLSTTRDSGSLSFDYFQSKDSDCVDEPEIRKDIAKFCENFNFYQVGFSKMDCACVTETSVAMFRQDPSPGKHIAFINDPAVTRACPFIP